MTRAMHGSDWIKQNESNKFKNAEEEFGVTDKVHLKQCELWLK